MLESVGGGGGGAVRDTRGLLFEIVALLRQRGGRTDNLLRFFDCRFLTRQFLFGAVSSPRRLRSPPSSDGFISRLSWASISNR